MRVAYCFTFASKSFEKKFEKFEEKFAIYQSLVLDNRRENGERMESDGDYKSEY